jgi:hypothetical protein
MYKVVFDKDGNRIASYHTDVHTDIPVEAIEISDEDQALYTTNEYFRGADGKPVKKSQQSPTAQQQYAAINVEYSAKQAALRDAAIDAQLNGKSLDSIVTARAKLSADWKEKLSAVQGA